MILTLAGDGAVALEVEALEVTLHDVTRPYRAPSGKVPEPRLTCRRQIPSNGILQKFSKNFWPHHLAA